MNPERKVKIITDSSAAIPPKILQEKEIGVVNATISFGKEQEFIDGINIDSSLFLDLLRVSPDRPTTAAANPEVYKKIYRENLPLEIVSVHLGNSWSSFFRNSVDAARQVNKDKITPYDSETVSMGIGFMAMRAADLANNGKSRNEILKELDSMKQRLTVTTTFNTLKYLQSGGRGVETVKRTLGKILQVKPVVGIDHNDMKEISYARKRSDSLAKLVEVTRRLTPLEQVGVVYGGDKEVEGEARSVVDELRKFFAGNIYLGDIGPAVLRHSGPGAIAVVSVRRKE